MSGGRRDYETINQRYFTGQSSSIHTETERHHTMSTALWCDKNNHAFSSKDPDKRHFTQTAQVEIPTGNSFGRTTYQTREEVTEELDICGPCWKNEDPFAPKAAAVEAAPTLADLEDEDTDYRRGYEAGVDHTLNAIGGDKPIGYTDSDGSWHGRS